MRHAIWLCVVLLGLVGCGTNSLEGEKKQYALGHKSELDARLTGVVEETRLAGARRDAVVAWRAGRDEEGALALARAYFPEFAGPAETSKPEAPTNPAAALQVRLAEVEGAEMELATRGHIFRVRELRPDGDAACALRDLGDAAFYGARHFLTRVGGTSVEGAGTWLTHRVEEYVVLEEGQPYRARYEVTMPGGVMAVKDAGEYLEFLDSANTPVLRLHYPVARDSAGLSRQGVLWLGNVTPEGQLAGGQARYALRHRTLLVEASVDATDMVGPVLVDPGWSSTGAMAFARYYHTATLLPSGKVLVAGGASTAGYPTAAELYDPALGTWASTGSLPVARYGHTATLLPSGKVLVAGGLNSMTPFAGAEVYDPTLDTWTSTGPMASARYGHTATLLPSGKILVAGGSDNTGTNTLATAELYDPALGTWASTSSMASPRLLHTAMLLPSDKVLVAGGSNNGTDPIATAEVYDPGPGTWASTGAMAVARYAHTATLLPSGEVLVAGASTGTTTELYDPGPGTWTSTSPMLVPRTGHTATLLPSGKVLGRARAHKGPAGGAEMDRGVRSEGGGGRQTEGGGWEKGSGGEPRHTHAQAGRQRVR